MNSLPSTFLQQSLADLQRTTMYKLIRKECQKPPQRIVRDNWPRLTIGLWYAYNFYACKDLFVTTADFFRRSFPILVSYVSPQTGEYPYRKGCYVFTGLMVVTNALVIFESISFIALCLRPSHNNHSASNNNSDQCTKSDASMQEASSIAVVKSVPAIASTSIPASSLWSKIQLPPFTTLRHAKWMYGHSLFSVVCTPLLISVLRYHTYWPNLWPWIWNDPFWMELVSGITASMDADILVETSWQKFDSTLGPILGVIMTVWGLRVWIRKMEEGQENEAEK